MYSTKTLAFKEAASLILQHVEQCSYKRLLVKWHVDYVVVCVH